MYSFVSTGFHVRGLLCVSVYWNNWSWLSSCKAVERGELIKLFRVESRGLRGGEGALPLIDNY
jgi:hypothetical protein